MHVPGMVYVSPHLKSLLDAELQQYHDAAQLGGFVPAVRQIANVASLPGIVKASIALPDVHSGYGFAIGNVAAFDMGNPDAVVSPGGVGFDINCGVRLLRTNLVRVLADECTTTTTTTVAVFRRPTMWSQSRSSWHNRCLTTCQWGWAGTALCPPPQRTSTRSLRWEWIGRSARYGFLVQHECYVFHHVWCMPRGTAGQRTRSFAKSLGECRAQIPQQ